MKAEAMGMTTCDKVAMDQFMIAIKSSVTELKDFNTIFSAFLAQQKKISRDLWNTVTRYNILDSGPPCVYPVVEKEELLTEMMVKIQEQTTEMAKSLSETSRHHENITKSIKALERQSWTLNWNQETNPLIKGTAKHRAPSMYLEAINDLTFQLDVSITCMFQYFDALGLHNVKSYENLMNAFNISEELVTFVNEFLINHVMLLV